MTSDFPFLSILDVEFARRSVDKLEEALKKKDQDLAEALKEVLDKTRLAEEKMASVGALEQENSRLKAALEVANQEVSRLKNDKVALHDKAGELAGKRNDLEAYLGGLAKKLFVVLEGNYSAPTILQLPSLCRATVLFLNRVCKILPELRRGNQSSGARLGSRQFSREGRGCYERAPLESRVTSVVDYLARLKTAMSRIDTSLSPETTLQNDLESLMVRLNEVPG